MSYTKYLPLFVCLVYFLPNAQAASPGGENGTYKIQTDTLDSGGAVSSAEPYCNHGTIGGIHGTSSVDTYGVTHGYLSQIPDFSGPILDLNGPDGGGVNFSGTLVEDGVAVTAADSDMTIDSLGAATLDSAVIKIANLLDGTKETLSVNTGGTSIAANYNTGTGVLTLTGNASVADYIQVFKTTLYNNSSQKPNETLRKIRFQVNGIDRDTCSATCSVTVVSVNDQPTFTKGPNQSVKDLDGGKTINSWATGIAPGPPEESAEGIIFSTANNNNSIFSIQPSVATNGTLTFAPAKFEKGSATVTVTLKDNAKTANGGVDTNTQTFTITVSTDSKTLMVNSASDSPISGKLTLREALNQVLNGDRIIFDTVAFAVGNPTDQNKIKPTTLLPELDKGNVLVDASNVKVILDGNLITGESCGLLVTSSDNIIRGFTIQEFTDVGLCVRAPATNNLIGGNRSIGGGSNGQGLRISGNGNNGMEITGVGASGNMVRGCWIGVNASGTQPESNNTGIVIKEGATNNIIGGGTADGEVNVISGNSEEGIAVFGDGTDGNLIAGNLIGAGAGTSRSRNGSRKLQNFIPLGNGFSGVGLSQGTKNNKVGGKKANEPNVIADNGKDGGSTGSEHGVSIRNEGTQRNAVRQNSILLNQRGGIGTIDGGNGGILPPKKTDAIDNGVAASDASKRSATIRGTSATGVNSEVDLFNDDGVEGEDYLGTAIVLSDGTWETTIDLDVQRNLTATVTKVDGSTSTFANFGKALEGSQDSDGDGFPDNVEVAAGTDPNSSTSTPFGGAPAPAVTPVTGVRLLVKLNYKIDGKDGIKLLSLLPIQAGFNPEGKELIVDVGGVVRLYKLNSKGQSPRGSDFAKVRASKKVRENGGDAKFLFGLKLGTLGASFVEEGMSNEDTPREGVSIAIPIKIYFEDQIIGGDIQCLYKAKANKKGLAKSKK